MPVMINEREYRNFARAMEIRAGENDSERIVEGYATTFDTPYLLYDWGDYAVFEIIDRNAFADCDMSDVIFQYNHEGRVFARNGNGTLECKPDAHGLSVRANLGGTELGRQLYDEIKGGYTNRMSFGFTVAEDERTTREDHERNRVEVTRRITKIKKLYDVSAVSIPANDATEISARTYSEGVIAKEQEERLNVLNERNRKEIELIWEVSI